MPKPAASYTVQIKRLEGARVRAAELPRSTVLNAPEMAALIGVRWPALRSWCNDVPGFEDSKAFERGGNGVFYQFKPLKTIDFLLRHYAKAQAAAAKKQNRVRKIVAGDALAGVSEEFTLDDLNKMISLSIKVQEQLERQGKLIDAEKVSSALTTLFASIQQAALRSAMEQDPNGQWPPELRDAFENAIRSVLSTMERAARDCLKALAPSG